MTDKKNKEEKSINEVNKNVEKMSDQELNAIVGAGINIELGMSVPCTPGQVKVGNICKKKPGK
jgi:hypothetical protein